MKPRQPLLILCLLLLGTLAVMAQRENTGDSQRIAKDSTLFDYLAVYDTRPDDANLNLKIATLYYEDGQYEKALPYALKAQETATNNVQTHAVLGNIYTRTKKHAFAIEAMRKAIALDPIPLYFTVLNINRVMLNTKEGVLDQYREFTHIRSFGTDTLVGWAKDAVHPYYTPTLFAKFNKDWSSLGMDEYFMLYFGQSVTPGYSPYGIGGEAVGTLKTLYKEGKYEEVIASGKKAFEQNPLDFDVNWYVGLSHFKLKQYTEYEKHMGIYRSLLLSIMSTGDGTAPATAYIVIKVSDEYELLSFMGYKSKGQALLQEQGHSFDKITVLDSDTNEEGEIYFNIDQPFGSLSKMFDNSDLKGGKNKKKKGK